MPKKPQPKVNFTQPPRWDCPPDVGLIVTLEMKKLLAQPGFLGEKNGGQRLRYLYSNQSVGFRLDDFSLFGQACFCGQVNQVISMLAAEMAPPLSKRESSYEYGYASMIILGSQRLSPVPGQSLTHHLALLKFLISRGLPLDVPDIAGYVALHHTVLGDSHTDKEELIRTLLSSGADINFQNRWGETPLHISLERGDITGINVLMEHGADIDILEGGGYSARGCYVNAGATVTANMEKWILKRSGKEEAPMTEKACDQCRVPQKNLKNCSKCLTVQYCSQNCQRIAWPDHKKKCKAFSSSGSATLVPYYLPPNTQGIPQEAFRRGYVGGLPTNPVPVSHLRTSHIPTNIPPGGKQVVVKIQIPPVLKKPDGSYGALLVYTKKRDFVCIARREDCQTGFDRVYDVVKEQSLSGLKGYFIADLKSKDELIVKVSELLAAQPW